MGNVLTDAAQLACPHQGKVTIVVPPLPRRKLTVNGAPVLLKADVAGRPIGSPVCPQPAQTIDSTVATVDGGEASRLTVNGAGVLVDDTFAGKSDKSGAVTVSPGGAGQHKLTAR